MSGLGITDLIKLQLVQSGVMGKTGEFTLWALLTQILQLMLIAVFEEITRCGPKIATYVRTRFVKETEAALGTMAESRGVSLSSEAVRLGSKHSVNSIVFSRRWSTSDEKVESDSSQEIIDAIMRHVSTLHNIPTLQLIGSDQFLVNFLEKPVEIFPSVYLQIESFKMNQKTLQMESMTFTVSSDVHSAKTLKDRVEKLRDEYLDDRQNNLGDCIWYFDQSVKKSRGQAMADSKDPHHAERVRVERILNALPEVEYEMRPFHSNKTFKNLYGTDVRKVEQRLEFFLERPDWYAEKGVPYQLGILLSGSPGSGKTSVIRAVANRTGRHIFNVKMSNIATATQLKNIFFSEQVKVVQEGQNSCKSLHIPLNKRLYVLEEIDTVGTLLLERTLDFAAPKDVLADELTLGDVLQALDGTIECPGRMIILTSNHPKRLDRALIRPGRVDLHLEFGKIGAETIHEMVSALLGMDVPLPLLPDKKLTAAEAVNVIFEFDPQDCYLFEADHSSDVVGRLCERLTSRSLELQNEEEELSVLRETMRLAALKEAAEKKQEELRRQKEKDRQRGGHRRDEPGDSALGMGLEFDSFLSR